MMMAEGDEFFTALSSAGWEVALPGISRQVRKGLLSALGWAPVCRGLPDWVSGDSSPQVQELKSSCEAGGQNSRPCFEGSTLSRLLVLCGELRACILHAGGRPFTYDFLLSRGGTKKKMSRKLEKNVTQYFGCI